MKKVVSLILVLALAISLLAACGKQESPADPSMTEPQTTEPPFVHDMPDNAFITGVFYRSESGQAIVLSPEHGTFILTNDLEDFAQVSDFAVVTFELDAVPDVTPAQVAAQNPTLTSQAANEEQMTAVDTLLTSMIDAGYEPATIGTIIDSNSHLYVTPYDAITTILDTLAAEEGNTMFSPLSMNFALGMAANGTSDEFKTKFENYFGMSIEDYNGYVQNYMQNASPWFGETVVDIANSIWLQQPLSLQDRYLDLMEIYYDAEVQSRDFNEAFVEEVNKWCADKTHNMIPAVLGEPPTSQALLINALYFEGKWDVAYEEYQVRDTEFTTNTGDVVTVDGMATCEETFYMENENATAFAKYYKDMRYAFVGILPKNDGDFKLADLDIESLMEADNMEFTEVASMIPKFKFNNAHPMLELLEKIGLPVEGMPLDKMADAALFITDVRQYTAVDVDETGTRAAAVTVVEADGAIMPNDEELPKEVILNRPFAFMIYDMENQTPLFVGKVVNPNT